MKSLKQIPVLIEMNIVCREQMAKKKLRDNNFNNLSTIRFQNGVF